MSKIVTANPWEQLRQHTQARIALGRAGTSLPTQPHLAFQSAHARARNAVHHPLDVDKLSKELARRGWTTLTLHSAASSRAEYLQRPDLGRRLSDASLQTAGQAARHDHDIAIAIVDGLSACAIETNALPFLDRLMPQLQSDGYTLTPLSVVEQGRVAIGDDIAAALGARLVIVLIGERPGLSSPDSMGIYMTWGARRGMNDAQRNCISNIRPAGLGYDDALHKLCYLVREAFARQLSGVSLKDETTVSAPIAAHAAAKLPAD